MTEATYLRIGSNKGLNQEKFKFTSFSLQRFRLSLSLALMDGRRDAAATAARLPKITPRQQQRCSFSYIPTEKWPNKVQVSTKQGKVALYSHPSKTKDKDNETHRYTSTINLNSHMHSEGKPNMSNKIAYSTSQ